MIVEVLDKKQTHKVEFYSTIRKLPIRRFAKFNKFLMVASEVGCSVEDAQKRLSRAMGYFAANDKKSGLQELNNMINTIHHAHEEYNPTHMALAVMVKSIDGKELESFQEDDLDNILDHLGRIGFNQKQAEGTTIELKKN